MVFVKLIINLIDVFKMSINLTLNLIGEKKPKNILN